MNLGIYNPALLNIDNGSEVSISYVNYFAGINNGYIAYAHQLDGKRTLSASLQFFNYGKSDRLDVSGNVIGSVSAADYNLNLGYSEQLDSFFRIGANFKTLYSNLDSYSSLAFAVDGGVYYTNHKGFGATVMIRNLGFIAKSYTDQKQGGLPFSLDVGVSFKPKHAPFRLSIVVDHLENWDLSIYDPLNTSQVQQIGQTAQIKEANVLQKTVLHLSGSAELLFSKKFYAVVGYNFRRAYELSIQNAGGVTGLSWGLGIRIKRFHFSYANAVYSRAGGSHHFTVTKKLSDFKN